MSAIGSLIFCNDCGNLLDESSGDPTKIIVCSICGARNKGNTRKHRDVSRTGTDTVLRYYP